MSLLNMLLGGGLARTPGIVPGPTGPSGAPPAPTAPTPGAAPSGLLELLQSPQIAAAASLLESSGPQLGAGVGTGQALGRALTSANQSSRANSQAALQRQLVAQNLKRSQRQEDIELAKEFTPESVKAYRAGEGDLVPRSSSGGPLTQAGKINADVQGGFISKELGDKLKSELGKANPDRIKISTNLRKEFNDFTKGPSTAIASLANAENLLNNGNPIAVQAAFTSFIRAIDDSVVRPSEQEAYSQVRGLAKQFEDMASKLAGKGPLSEGAKAELRSAIQSLRAASQGIIDRSAEFYSTVAQDAEVNPELVVGAPVASVTQSAPSVAPQAQPSPDFGPDSGNTLSNANPVQL